MTQTLIAPDQRTSVGPTTPADATSTVACPDCGSRAVVEWSSTVAGTDGLVEHVKIRCANRHWFLMPRDRLSP